MKEFFKPTIWKILIPLFYIWLEFNIEYCREYACSSLLESGLLRKASGYIRLVTLYPPAALMDWLDINAEVYARSLIWFAVYLVYLYILSCLLVWLYHKIRKPKTVLDKLEQ